MGCTNTLAEIRGFERVYYDVYDNPGMVHNLMKMISDYNMWKLDYLQEKGLLTLNNDAIDTPSGILGYTDDLPHRHEHVMLRDIWGFGEAQELSIISPSMFEEFVLPYQARLLNRFGLTSYGCCEPLERRIDVIMRQLPNLRRVSVSPWSNKRIMAEKLGDKYLYSWKFNPVYLAVPNIDEAAIRAELRS
jgi:hypothetical protein